MKLSALPTDFSAGIARNTQIYLQEETNICKSIDPWAGSYYVESLTHEIAHRAWELIEEIENLGGMAKAIESGIHRRRIEEAAVRAQQGSTQAFRPLSEPTSTGLKGRTTRDT